MSVQARPQRLARSSDGLAGGVFAGFGKYYDVSPWVFRGLWLVAVLCYGVGFLLYFVLWWLMPREDNLPFEPATWERGEGGQHHPPFERTVVDRKVAGVCGGLARRWDVDPLWIRLGFVGLVFASLGLALLLYIGAAVLIPPSSQHGNIRGTTSI